jgi:hypothetical protein
MENASFPRLPITQGPTNTHGRLAVGLARPSFLRKGSAQTVPRSLCPPNAPIFAAH